VKTSACFFSGVFVFKFSAYCRKINFPVVQKTKFTLSKTKYLMDDKVNEDRSIYSFNIDSKLLLERNTYLFGKNSIQTLTPIV
jgi:lipopolysaccharide assembly outer membrane protein LptD (OstA)